MKLCAEHHQEICYEAGYCPVCDKQEEVERLELLVEELREELNNPL